LQSPQILAPEVQITKITIQSPDGGSWPKASAQLVNSAVNSGINKMPMLQSPGVPARFLKMEFLLERNGASRS